MNQYRSNPDFIPELDFVMEENGRLIGHVMFSKASLQLPDGTSKPSTMIQKVAEATFPPKEKDFAPGQLPQFCQSCGMPLTRKENCGTNADGTVNYDYCQYC